MDLERLKENIQSANTNIAIFKDQGKSVIRKIRRKYRLRRDQFEGRLKEIKKETKSLEAEVKSLHEKAEEILEDME